MEIVININATSAEDYRNAIKALMDGAGMVGFDIPGLPVKRVSYVITGWIGEHKGRVIPATTLARQLVSQERRY